jgi:hypothetical protein
MSAEKDEQTTNCAATAAASSIMSVSDMLFFLFTKTYWLCNSDRKHNYNLCVWMIGGNGGVFHVMFMLYH